MHATAVRLQCVKTVFVMELTGLHSHDDKTPDKPSILYRNTTESEKLPNRYGSVTSSERNGPEKHELHVKNIVQVRIAINWAQ